MFEVIYLVQGRRVVDGVRYTLDHARAAVLILRSNGHPAWIAYRKDG